jgi:hypothetical protein
MKRFAEDMYDAVPRRVIDANILHILELAEIEMYASDRDDVQRFRRRGVELR